MNPPRRVLLDDATPEELTGRWPIIRCAGCDRNFVWIFEASDRVDPPKFHAKGCKRGKKAKPYVSRVAIGPMRVSGMRCPACGKVAAPTLEAAKMEKARVESVSGRRDTVRYYTCESGYVHWTRMNATAGG